MQARTVMIVDDSTAIRELITAILELDGFSVIEANNGRDALTKLTLTSPSLIITDLNMPEMNGLTFTQEIKRSRHQSIPILMLTAENPNLVKQQAVDVGITDWLAKPFCPSDLSETVSRMIYGEMAQISA